VARTRRSAGVRGASGDGVRDDGALGDGVRDDGALDDGVFEDRWLDDIGRA